MDRRELHDELESCHARGQAEDAYNKRKKAVKDIEEGLDKYVRPILKQEKRK